MVAKALFMRVYEKTTENSKRLVQQAQPRIETETSGVPAPALVGPQTSRIPGFRAHRVEVF